MSNLNKDYEKMISPDRMEEMAFDIREWTCPKCATHHDRDVNASINILQEGIKIMNGWNDQDSLLILSSLEDIA